MKTKIVIIFKYITISLTLIFLTTSCEKEIENVGGELVNNGAFDLLKKDIEVTAYSKNTIASRVDNIDFLSQNQAEPALALGIYTTPEFGLLKATILSQVLLPTVATDWGENPIIDEVYLEIPYDATKTGTLDDGKPEFKINKVYGDETVEFQVRVSKLATFLNKLDPLDPSKNNKYYSNDTYNTADVLYPWTNFKPNAKDTVLYFNRTLLDVAANNYNEIQVEDTIKKAESAPFIRFKLNKTFFENEFVNNVNQTPFEDQNDFLNFFNGIALEVDGTNGSILSLDISKAFVNIYYTNTEDKTEDETTIDLNGDGDTNDTDVTYPVRTKKTMAFPFSKTGQGVKTNGFIRDYTGSNAATVINSPNTVDGEKLLYVQGAAGSMVELDLFTNEDINAIRAENWLINEASLTFYIDQNASGNTVPNRLLLYKVDTDLANDINENEQILDALTQIDFFNGYLQNDSIDEDANAYKYKVNITDYISKILKEDDFIEPQKLGLKLYNATDVPLSLNDKLIEDFSWDPRGVVLYGNNYTNTEMNFDKRIKLEIHYTKAN